MNEDRLDKLDRLKDLTEIFPSIPEKPSEKNLSNKELANYNYINSSLLDVRIAVKDINYKKILEGRVKQINDLGKCMFIQIDTEVGLQQIFIEKSIESFNIAKLLQTGDFIRAAGKLFYTNQGKICLYVVDLIFCGKALKDVGKVLKDKIEDVEILRRQRYLDYIMNGTETIKVRSKVIKAIRDLLFNEDYIEVETRTLLPINSGANAKPFITKYNKLDEDFYLRVAPELDLKRLLVGGLNKVFEIGKCFRNEGISNKHNPEFTSLEVYTSFSNYVDAMSLCNSIIEEAFIKYNGERVEMFVFSFQGLMDRFSMSAKYEDQMNVFEDKVEPKLKEEFKDKFVVIEDFPTYSCPLAKKCKDEKYIERFEVYYNSMEIANGYSELNDPIEQRKRFSEQQLLKDKMDLDEDFITALEYGMPPASGLGIGIDRLMMILINKENIKDVITFPPYKNK